MADTKTLIERHDTAMARIAKVLAVQVVDLEGAAPGDPQMARVLTTENIADALEGKGKFKKPTETAPANEAKG